MVFATAVAVSAAVLLVVASRGGLLLDDFNTLGSRFQYARDHGWWAALNAAHNNHWSLTFFALYATLVQVFGLDTYVPMATLAVSSAVLVVVLVRRVMLLVGTSRGIAAIWPVSLLWWGTASTAVLWGFDAVFTLAEAVVLALVVLLAREGRRSTVAAAALVLVGVTLQMSAVIGSLVVLAVWVVAAEGRSLRRARCVRAAVVAAPGLAALAVWSAAPVRRPVLWSALPGEQDAYNVAPELVEGLRYAMAIGRRVLSGFLPVPGGRVVDVAAAIVVGGLLTAAMVRRRHIREAWPVVIGLPAAAVVLVVTIGVTRVGAEQGPAVSRYVHLATALLFPLAGLALSDVTQSLGRVIGRWQPDGDGRRALPAAVMVLCVGTLIMVGAERTVDAATLLRRLSAASEDRLRALLADPMIELVPGSTRVSHATLDLTVGHVRALGAEGLLSAQTGGSRVRSDLAVLLHVRPSGPNDVSTLAVGPVAPSTLPTTCWTSAGDTATTLDVVTERGSTGYVSWSIVPRRLAVRVAVDGTESDWREIVPVSSLEIDGLDGAVVHLRVVGPASTC